MQDLRCRICGTAAPVQMLAHRPRPAPAQMLVLYAFLYHRVVGEEHQAWQLRRSGASFIRSAIAGRMAAAALGKGLRVAAPAAAGQNGTQ